MSLSNMVILDGHVGKDPEVRFMPKDGKRVISVTLATNDHYKDRETGERKSRTDWHNLSIGGSDSSIDNFMKFVKQGTALKVIGQARSREYQDGDKKAYFHYVRVNEWLLGPKKQDNAAPTGGESQSNGGYDGEDDIPI